MKNPVCIHFHIFKNAGTTLEWIFKKNFSKHSLSIDSGNPGGLLHFEKILEILKEKPKTRSISSHQFRFPIYDDAKFEFIPIIFLRHPIDRAISIYHFQRKRTDANRPGIAKAKELDLDGYIKWNLKLKNHMVMKNFQVLYLSDKSVGSRVEDNDCKIALKRMKESKIIGVVDNFDESLVVAEEYLRKFFSEIDLSYRPQNVSSERKSNLQERMQDELKKIDKETQEELFENNNYDLMLYETTKEELNNRILKIENFEAKLEDFKNRCKKI